MNKQRPLPKSQLEFWTAPPATSFAAFTGSPSHDPRGSPAYIREFVLPFRRSHDAMKTTPPISFWGGGAGGFGGGGNSANNDSSSSSKGAVSDEGTVLPRHRLHPNIVDSLFGVVRPVSTSAQEQSERLKAMSGMEPSEGASEGALAAGNGAMPDSDCDDEGKVDEEDDIDEEEVITESHQIVDDFSEMRKSNGDQ